MPERSRKKKLYDGLFVLFHANINDTLVAKYIGIPYCEH